MIQAPHLRWNVKVSDSIFVQHLTVYLKCFHYTVYCSSTWHCRRGAFSTINSGTFFFSRTHTSQVLQINSTCSTANISHTEWPLALYGRERLCNRLTFKRLRDNENPDRLVFAKNSSYFPTLGRAIRGKLFTERWSCPCMYHADTSGECRQSSIQSWPLH